MFETLPQFYNSDAWRTFRANLIQERTDANGNLYCEYSGKLLVNSYDIVAHHKIPLTPANVNDFNISLNADNIMIVSQDAHNQIHKRFGYTAERKVYYVYGAPCSGKTAFVNRVKGNSDIVVDVDNIWQCITGGERYFKPDALKMNAFAVRDCLFDMIRTRAGKWERAFVIEGGARKGDRERKISILGAEPIFINTDKQTCIKRLLDAPERIKQREQWTQYIEDWFEQYQE